MNVCLCTNRCSSVSYFVSTSVPTSELVGLLNSEFTGRLNKAAVVLSDQATRVRAIQINPLQLPVYQPPQHMLAGWHDALLAFYAEHDPGKDPNVIRSIFDDYKSKLWVLDKQLTQKYGEGVTIKQQRSDEIAAQQQVLAGWHVPKRRG